MSSLHLLLILLSVSVHACHARFPSFFVKESTVGKQDYLLVQDVGKAKTYKTAVQLELGHSALRDNRNRVQKATGKNEENSYMNQDGANTMKPDEYSKDLLKEAAATKSATSGVIVPSPNELQRWAKTEELPSMSSQARSLLGSSPNDNDDALDSRENDVVEDTEAMDYAQPHRKPPIHNEKPQIHI